MPKVYTFHMRLSTKFLAALLALAPLAFAAIWCAHNWPTEIKVDVLTHAKSTRVVAHIDPPLAAFREALRKWAEVGAKSGTVEEDPINDPVLYTCAHADQIEWCWPIKQGPAVRTEYYQSIPFEGNVEFWRQHDSEWGDWQRSQGWKMSNSDNVQYWSAPKFEGPLMPFKEPTTVTKGGGK
jgi:hypothetical protein